MSADILQPPTSLSQADALALSQEATTILRSLTSWNFPWPLSLFVNNDTPEKWASFENLLFSCLRTGDDKSALACLEQLKQRFGESNERVMGLIGLYHEAIAKNDQDLTIVLKSYEDAITEKPTNMVIRKRHVALLNSMGQTEGAIAALCDLLDVVPTDAEAWSELAELYFAQGMFQQALYSLEEVLLVMPNAWNVHARFGEMVFIAGLSDSSNQSSRLQSLSRSLKSFCRSAELCDDYLRGYYGLKMTTLELKTLIGRTASKDLVAISDAEFQIPSLGSVQSLDELATSKLAEIIRRHSTQERGWQGYSDSEIIAARALLNKDGSTTR